MKEKRLAKFRSDRQVTLLCSYKNDSLVHIWSESQLERNTQRYFEYQQDVISYKAQPTQYEYLDDKGAERSYTPDLEVSKKTGAELIEIKPEIFTRSTRAKASFSHLRGLFSEKKNLKYSYITDKDVYAGSTTENLKRIHHFRRLSIAKINISKLVESVGTQTTFGELKVHVEALGLQAKHALALLGHQVFIFDYKQVLTDTTILTTVGI
jgi:hypothetical protein